jgi:CubicO group peptidase (beta-lactamase class C family)
MLRSAVAVFALGLLVASAGVGRADAQAPKATPESAATRAPSGGTIVSPSIRRLRDALAPQIESVRARLQVPAVSLVLVRSDQVLWAEGFGAADPRQGRAASADTVYRAGSLAKPFTALATLALAEAGRIDLDAPLATALPKLTMKSRFDSAAQITPRMLLSHHAGVPSDLHKGLWSDTPFAAVTTQLRDELAAFPPNLVFSYSNVGYTLLGDLVQTTAAEPFAAYLERTLFAPLGMRATRIAALPAAADRLAVGHRGGAPLAPLPIRDLPAQGLETSAADLGRFLIALLCGGELHGRQVLAPGLIEAMMMPQNAAVALDLDVATGLGWFLEDGTVGDAGPVVRHGGTTLGFAAELVLLPEAGLGVAVLASSGDARRVVVQLAETILTHAAALVPEPLPPELFVSASPAASDRPAAGGTAIGADGHFATDLGLIAIAANGEDDRHTLCACMEGARMDLVRGADGWLRVDAQTRALPAAAQALASMRYQARRIGEREVVVADTGTGPAVLGEKLPAEPLPAAWRARLGRYKVINADAGFPVTDLRLSLTDGKVCFGYRMPVLSSKRIQMPVRPLDDDSGVIVGLGRNRGDTLRFVAGAGEEAPLLRWSGYLARRVDDGGPSAAPAATAMDDGTPMQ